MIIVIADDITGAAELAGIALRYHLRVLVAGDVLATPGTDVLVVYTNTRSMPEQDAVAVMSQLTQKAKALQPVLFYKKTDSVLRGHVLAEMKTQMAVLQVSKGLLVPVNPALGRTIKDGQYYVNGQPVHQAGFANDPEFPINRSQIRDMLGANGETVKVLKTENGLPVAGVAVGEAQTLADVEAWAGVVSDDALLAGGASFFNALLQRNFEKVAETNMQRITLSYPVLFVSGTTYEKNTTRLKSLSSLVSYMPDFVFTGAAVNSRALVEWSRNVVQLLQKNNVAIVAVQDKKIKTDPALLRQKMSEAVRHVVQQTAVREVLIEGGSTAYSIVQKMGWQRFVPTEELAQGVVRMQLHGTAGVHLTIKPGSYEWPPEWNFLPSLR